MKHNFNFVGYQKHSLTMTMLIFMLVLLYSFSTSFAQDKNLKEVAKAEEIKEIKIPLDLYNLLHIKELEVQNLELQIRLALKVPNDFNRAGDLFKPSPTLEEKKKDEKIPLKPQP